MRGKWAQGIVPRNFRWILKDHLAVCERPGGYGENHRRVRRQEEIIWIRENEFTYIVSLIATPKNLHNYDELGVAWLHRPMPEPDQSEDLAKHYQELSDRIDAGEKLLMHHEELADLMAGYIAGYLVWRGLVPEPPEAITVVEQMLERQLGPGARETVVMAAQLRNES